MPFRGFTQADFKVFDIEGFAPRMAAIKSRIRPKLDAAGRDLIPDITRIGGAPAFAHVAKHMRRTVNAPDDTWVAFAADKRGYKKHCHFKVAVSRGAVRFLFEAGPEHAGKKKWIAAWKRHAPKLVPVFRRAKGLAWFKNEHDETPSRHPLRPLGGGDRASRRRAAAYPRRPACAGTHGEGGGGRALEARGLRAGGARNLLSPCPSV